MRAHIADGSVDLVLADPPYGIGGDGLDVHYNRDERFAVEGYVEVGSANYPLSPAPGSPRPRDASAPAAR